MCFHRLHLGAAMLFSFILSPKQSQHEFTPGDCPGVQWL
jgi:hypothetical protein